MRSPDHLLKAHPRLIAWGLSLLVFLVAFVPRAYYQVSRSLVWYTRSYEFASAVRYGHWADTYFRYHPGVMTMWIAGPPMFLYNRHVIEKGADRQFIELLGWPEDHTGQQLEVGVIALALVISLGIMAGGWLLRDLLDWRAGLAASLMMALGPPFLSSSKQLHVDALMTVFMLLSALLVLRHIKAGGWRWLLLSGFAGGLASLTKVPALFLLPYTGLALLAGALWGERPRPRHLSGLMLRRVALPTLVWVGVAALTFVALWPAMWVNPLETLRGVWGGLTLHTGRPHPSTMYFAGSVTGEDPGFWFYVAALLLEPTFVSLTLALASLVIFAVWRKRPQVRRDGLVYWMLVAFLFFFWLQMTLAAKKQTRYLLPSMVMLDALAGIGLARIADLVRLRASRGWAGGLIALGLASQAALVLPRHPDYGTYYNDLFGGAQVAAHYLPIGWWGEGADRLADYLEARPDITPNQAVWAPYRIYGMIERRYSGTMDVYGLLTAPWLVFDVNNTVRDKHAGKDWESYWEAALYREPEAVIAYDGLPYLWLYRNDLFAPPDPDALRHPLEAELGGGLRLRGYEVNDYLGRIGPGEMLRGTLFVEGEGSSIEVGLLGRDGAPAATGWAEPERTAGEIVRVPFEIEVPEGAQGGAYVIAVREASGKWLNLTGLEVRRFRPTPVMILAWLWTGGLVGLLVWLGRRAGQEPER
jgi:4-amino-4-deoxy-L-arabinose transferase-like glycosyltransferase